MKESKKEDTYVYAYGNALYVNLTNRCTSDCTFCLRKKKQGVGHYNLWLSREPTAEDVIRALGDMRGYDEVVFCGFGEPMIRLDEIKRIAAYAKQKDKKTRIDTNGQANAYHGRDVTPELKGLIDAVSVSLNAADAARYHELCRSVYGQEAYGHVLAFARGCVREGIKTEMTVVDVIGGGEIDAARNIAEGVGATFKVRHYV